MPEYSNAGGISDAESMRKSLPRAKEMLDEASKIAKENSTYVAINVLEKSAEIDPKWKHMRLAGFGEGFIRNDDFINNGLCPNIFNKRNDI